jgi:hypothetical protein
LKTSIFAKSAVMLRRAALRPTDRGLHACQQLSRAEGLGDVVVGSDLEQQNFVGHIRDRAQDDDGGRRGDALEDAADVSAGHAGQHQVEHHRGRPEGVHGGDAVGPIAGYMHRVSLGLELPLESLLDARIVFHHENRAHHTPAGRVTAREQRASCQCRR